MKKLYHLSLSSPGEVLFRSQDDYRRAFNCYVVALLKSDSLSFADAFMSNHLHLCITSKSLKEFCYLFRIGYAKYFNNKYYRGGKLGEDNFFVLEVEGIRHIIAAVSYVLRNPVHHGISSTPFEYPYSSANIIFAKELGKGNIGPILPKEKIWRYLPKNLKLDIPCRMDVNGMFLREDITEIRQVEMLYGTPRNYLYYMNRLSDSKWENEQKTDEVSHSPITLSNIERIKESDITPLLRNEYGREDYRKMRDLDLCKLVDTHFVKKYKARSVYQLSRLQKNEIANDLYSLYRITGVYQEQIERCLAMNYSFR